MNASCAEMIQKMPEFRYLSNLLLSLPDIKQTLTAYGSFRHWGHPFIDYKEGLKFLHHNVTVKKDIDEDYANLLASDLAYKVLHRQFAEKKKWFVDGARLSRDHPMREHVDNNTWPSPAQAQDFGDQWHTLPLTKCWDIPEVVDPSLIYSDKSHSIQMSDLISHVASNSDRPIPSLKVLETLLKKDATIWPEFLARIEEVGLDPDDLLIGLKAKEREIGEKGRYFSLMSWALREYFVFTEYLIKSKIVPLFHGLTMADDQITLIKKLIQNSAGQGGRFYSEIGVANHLDYEKWNNHQRKEATNPVFVVMGKFFGLPKLFERTHEFFEKSLIYYKDRPDLMEIVDGHVQNKPGQMICWNGQAGGLEGLRQKGWSVLNLLVIEREAKIRNTRIKILAQGDNQVICTQYKIRDH